MTVIWPVDRLPEVDSTNTEARRRALVAGFQDHWIVADRQTAGRGREARVWASPAGNLFATALFREPSGLPVALRLPFASALAVSDTVLAFAPAAPLALKWPNDVRIGGRKIAGILIETGSHDDVFWVAAGIGLNVENVPDHTGQAATCLRDIGAISQVKVETVLDFFVPAFARRLAEARHGFSKLRQDWLALAEGLGGNIEVRAGDQVLQGRFEDMDFDGGLVLRLHDGECRTIKAGEVNLIGGF